MAKDEDYFELKRKYDELANERDELKGKVERLKELIDIYGAALSLTDHVISYVDVQKHTLNHIHKESTFDGITDVMENVPDAVLNTGIIPPEDVKTFRDFYDLIYAGKPSGESGIFRTTEGDRRGYVKMYFKTIFSDDGVPLKAVCFSDDITSKYKAELQYNEYKRAVTSSADYFWEANVSQNKLIGTDEFAKISLKKYKFKNFSEMIENMAKTVIEEYQTYFLESFDLENMLNGYSQGQREFILEYPWYFDIKSKRIVWFQTKVYLLADLNGDINAIICSKDVTERKKQENELLQQAELDVLTGLYNRRSFTSRAKAFIENCGDEEAYFIIIDVDNFKSINDTWGHMFGDEVLTRIADAMQKCFRSLDLLARVGGDEFMIMTSKAFPKETLAQRLTDIKEMLTGISTPDRDATNVGLSVGIATFKNGMTFDGLYQIADKALYIAKEHGKNGFVFGDE